MTTGESLKRADALENTVLMWLMTVDRCGLADIWGAVLLSLEQLSARGEEAGVVCVVDWSDCPARLNAELSAKSLRLVLDGLQVSVLTCC